MIAESWPFELLVVFADQDAEYLIRRLIERGQERGCLRPFRWFPLKAIDRDSYVAKPREILYPHLGRPDLRILLTFDKEGSGKHNMSVEDAEKEVFHAVSSAGANQDSLCVVCFDPELESIFHGVWPKINEILRETRKKVIGSPGDDRLLAIIRKRHPELTRDRNLEELQTKFPKEYFRALVEHFQLRPSSTQFAQIGNEVSIPALKKMSAIRKIDIFLQNHFKGTAQVCSE